ncbi:MAG: hypothetical protein JKX68_08450 [Flavobacteriales bacterium]|nr:hypothetical protein [Flavobacteriales bacterium]
MYKIKLKSSILYLALTLPFFGFSQAKLSKDFKISVGTPYQVVDAHMKNYTSIDDGKGRTISFKTRGDVVTVQVYDYNSMKESSRKVYQDFPKYTKVQEILKAGDHIYYVFQAYNKKAKTFSVYSREVDTEKGTFKEIKKLFTTKRPVTMIPQLAGAIQNAYGMGNDLKPKFSVIPSFDGSKILIRYRLKPKSRSDATNYDELGFYVYDNSFNEVWGKEVKMPYTEKKMNNLAYTVGSDGTAYMLALINANKSFELLSVDANGLKSHKLDLKKDLMFNQFKLAETKKGNIVAVGYYAHGLDFSYGFGGGALSWNMEGLYSFEIDKTGKLIRQNEYPFDTDFIKQYKSARQKGKVDKRDTKGHAGINDLLIRNFILNDDNSMVVIAEKNYTKNEWYGTGTQYVTHFGNMIVTKIKADGSLDWMKKLPKNQACVAKDVSALKGLGMTYMSGEGAHYIIYVDNRKNAFLTLNQVPVAHKGGYGGYLSAYKVDDTTGEVEKLIILDLTDINGKKAYQFHTTRIFKAKEKTFLLEFYAKGKKDNVVKIEIVK